MTIIEERDHRITLKITLSKPIDDLQVDEVAELTTDAMIAAGYPVESYAAHLGDPLPAGPGEDLARDQTWVLRGSPAAGTVREAAG